MKLGWVLSLLPVCLLVSSCGGTTMMSFWVEPRTTSVACCQPATIQFKSFAQYSNGRTEELTLFSGWSILTPPGPVGPGSASVDGKGLVTVSDFCARRYVTVLATYGPADRLYMAMLYFDPCV
jgi:hypothetical protein